ncbi:G2/mitotic-specific cyclin-B3 [Eupeodes corollae]|uniref:G2/mitotic-specific cyclin-B3 n=1 Tax=Eupeodes corollae TaxID=290404 RepID=UPI002493A526|nr:G2/mitotic-specific cyclin-B3 [Eupeodes corollae]
MASKQAKNLTNKSNLLPLARKGITKRSQNIQGLNGEPIITRKRKAENSPLKNDKIKRTALGNLTNNVNALHLDNDVKKVIAKVQNDAQKKATAAIKKDNGATTIVLRPTKVCTRANTRNAIAQIVEDQKAATVVKKKDDFEVIKPPTRRISNEFNKTEESLYMSALEDISGTDSARSSEIFESKRRSLSQGLQKKEIKEEILMELENENRISTPSPLKNHPAEIPDEVVDFDKANWNDPFQVSHYAMDIFNYLKTREVEFVIVDYMPKQAHLSKWMRSLLVDWMVEVQETFELNHETLYLAVKVVDIFLGKQIIHKEKLQLLGASALFIASKYDERTPPLIEDFLYICDGAYSHDELIKMEKTTLKTINYDLGIPLSYRFLRRYARCAKVPMPTLTLARYILEFSLMDYETIFFSDSKMACAALMIALRMNGEVDAWTKTLVHYTGYTLEDFKHIIPVLNAGLHRKPKDTIKTIRSKYSHKIFHEVAKCPLLSTAKILENPDTSMTLEDKEN